MIKENLDNLTGLWKTAAGAFDAVYENEKFSYCYVPQSQWPNRLWFHHDIEDVPLPDLPLTLVYFDLYNNEVPPKGFVPKFKQTGMSLALKEKFPTATQLRYERVASPKEALIWADTFTKAFNYLIWDEIILRTQPSIQYYLVWLGEQPIGTAVLYVTGNIAGIHSIGVVPEMRRKGFAMEIMYFILNEALNQGCAYATLQASVMGKGMYEQLGFSNDFNIINYRHA